MSNLKVKPIATATFRHWGSYPKIHKQFAGSGHLAWINPRYGMWLCDDEFEKFFKIAEKDRCFRHVLRIFSEKPDDAMHIVPIIIPENWTHYTRYGEDDPTDSDFWVLLGKRNSRVYISYQLRSFVKNLVEKEGLIPGDTYYLTVKKTTIVRSRRT